MPTHERVKAAKCNSGVVDLPLILKLGLERLDLSRRELFILDGPLDTISPSPANQTP